MLILGIDPGYATTGFGLIRHHPDGIELLDCGVITTSPELPHGQRIQQTISDLLEIIEEFQPQEVALEEVFFSKNVTTALKVAECRGAIIYEMSRQQLPLTEYKPNQIKMNLCGYGAAPKIQMQKMVQLMLNLSTLPQPDDAADALAIALCHAHYLQQKIKHFS